MKECSALAPAWRRFATSVHPNEKAKDRSRIVRTNLPLFVWESIHRGQPAAGRDNEIGGQWEKDTGIIRYDRSNTFSNCAMKIIRRWFYKRIFFFFFAFTNFSVIFIGIKDKEWTTNGGEF